MQAVNTIKRSESMNNVTLWWKYLTNTHTVYDGSTCEFSKKFFNIHDYKIGRGGNGHPEHFHEYTCRECGNKFTI